MWPLLLAAALAGPPDRAGLPDPRGATHELTHTLWIGAVAGHDFSPQRDLVASPVLAWSARPRRAARPWFGLRTAPTFMPIVGYVANDLLEPYPFMGWGLLMAELGWETAGERVHVGPYVTGGLLELGAGLRIRVASDRTQVECRAGWWHLRAAGVQVLVGGDLGRRD